MPSTSRTSDHPVGIGSFRDPGGRVICTAGRIFRVVSPESLSHLTAFLDCDCGRQAIEKGEVCATRRLSEAEFAEIRSLPAIADAVGDLEVGAVVEHPPIWFPSFPYEWPPEMLHAAASLTIRLAIRLAPDFRLKDATPYNILFSGPRPVFVDVLSFERREPRSITWLAYAQFIRTFLLPLLAWKRLRLAPASLLLARRDGVEPDEMCRWLTPLARVCPPALTLVTLPAWLGKRPAAGLYRPHETGSEEKAAFIFSRVLHGLSRHLRRVTPPEPESRWSAYLDTQRHYGEREFQSKEDFVRQAIEESRPRTVLDIGCNTGHFSLLAARHGASVIAIDSDTASAGAAWRAASAGGLDILPLVVDIARPTPPVGWMNRECPSFLERAEETFDLVLMLALVHHLIVSERVPLTEIVSLAARLTRRWVVVEYVDPADPMFVRIARGRDALHQGLNREVFEAAWRKRFEIIRDYTVGETKRHLYFLRKPPV